MSDEDRPTQPSSVTPVAVLNARLTKLVDEHTSPTVRQPRAAGESDLDEPIGPPGDTITLREVLDLSDRLATYPVENPVRLVWHNDADEAGGHIPAGSSPKGRG